MRLLSLRTTRPPSLRPSRWAFCLAVVLAGSTAAAAARGTASFEPCYGSSGVLCGTVKVPLDREGRIGGTVPLHVEELPAPGRARGVMFVLGGGPGQAATQVFDLAANAATLRALVPGYTLVTFDPRGTGQSGVLRCPSFETDIDFAEQMSRCAAAIGSAVSSYATRDHAEDIEAVRAALGIGKIALWGGSYGAKLALAYALAHPEGVERLLLDSPLPANGPHPFARSTLQALPRALRSLCGYRFCRGVTRNLSADLASLANALQKKPLKRGGVYVDGQSLLALAVGADANGGLRAQLPTAVVEARRGRTGLLLRLSSPGGRVPPDPTFSFPLYVATTCGDASFPWQQETPLAERSRAYDSAVEALPAGATGPFGRWAARMGTASFCSFWPPSGPGAPLAAGPLPDVPVLVLSGGFDMRTPTESARRVAALFRRATFVRVPGLGHGVVASDSSGCAARAILAWLDGRRPSSCAPVRPVVAPVGPLTPLPVGHRVRAERALAAVATTLRSAVAAWYTSGRGPSGTRLRGLRGGVLSSSGEERFSLNRFSDLVGVELTGRLDAVTAGRGPLVQVQGKVQVTGRRDVRGLLTVSGIRISGRLAGVEISG